MARRAVLARAEQERVLQPLRQSCPSCRQPMRICCENRRTLVTLSGAVRLRLTIHRCEREDCPRQHTPYRPEAEGAIALAQHEFGLDVIALVGTFAIASTATCRRSTPSCASAGSTSPSAA